MDSLRGKIIVALDVTDKAELNSLLASLKDHASFVKVGMELFYAHGASILETIKNNNFKIFLDLKLHDIPSTVGKAIKNIFDLDIQMTNVHAAGGLDMMIQAKKNCPAHSLLIAVTQLTSTSEKVLREELGIDKKMPDIVVQYAMNAQKAGLNGVVASPLEVPAIKQACGKNFLTVTPGIRLPEDESQDQKRITTPWSAFKNGSDYIVMGRSITGDKNPGQKFEEILQRTKDALQNNM